jgi:redox-regulated HSP33 family molecular chaperone
MLIMPAIDHRRSRQKLIECADALRADLAVALDILNGSEKHEGDLLFPLQFDGTVGVIGGNFGFGGKRACGRRGAARAG